MTNFQSILGNLHQIIDDVEDDKYDTLMFDLCKLLADLKEWRANEETPHITECHIYKRLDMVDVEEVQDWLRAPIGTTKYKRVQEICDG